MTKLGENEFYATIKFPVRNQESSPLSLVDDLIRGKWISVDLDSGFELKQSFDDEPKLSDEAFRNAIETFYSIDHNIVTFPKAKYFNKPVISKKDINYNSFSYDAFLKTIKVLDKIWVEKKYAQQFKDRSFEDMDKIAPYLDTVNVKDSEISMLKPTLVLNGQLTDPTGNQFGDPHLRIYSKIIFARGFITENYRVSDYAIGTEIRLNNNVIDKNIYQNTINGASEFASENGLLLWFVAHEDDKLPYSREEDLILSYNTGKNIGMYILDRDVEEINKEPIPDLGEMVTKFAKVAKTLKQGFVKAKENYEDSIRVKIENERDIFSDIYVS